MYEVRDQKKAVEQWVDSQSMCPTRKEAIAQFPDVPHRIIKSAIQSREDRERRVR